MDIKIRFLRAGKEGWDFPEKTILIENVNPEILLSDLSGRIIEEYGIPIGRNHAFYMDNDVRKTWYDDLNDRDRSQDGYLGDTRMQTLVSALKGKKFKYEYSFSDELVFQCEVI